MPGSERLDLKVGFACNNLCLFCAQGDKRAACPSVDLAELERRLESQQDRSGGLVLTGGEPTMHGDIARIANKARALGYDPIQLQSNGRILSYDAALQTLVRAGVSQFNLSLHGVDAETHDALTRAPGSFEQSLDGIRNVLRAGCILVTNTVVTRQNVATLPRIIAFLGDLGVHHAQLAFVHPVGTAWDEFDAVVPTLPEAERAIREAREEAKLRTMALVTEAVPLCFLRGMEELAIEARIPQTTVIDLDGEAGDHSHWRVAEGKAHGGPCEGCSMRPSCEGPWREYPQRRGWSEFEPFT